MSIFSTKRYAGVYQNGHTSTMNVFQYATSQWKSAVNAERQTCCTIYDTTIHIYPVNHTYVFVGIWRRLPWGKLLITKRIWWKMDQRSSSYMPFAVRSLRCWMWFHPTELPIIISSEERNAYERCVNSCANLVLRLLRVFQIWLLW